MSSLTSHVFNMKRVKQFISFKNLNRGKNNYPTDLDGLFELRDRLFIIFEAKLEGVDMPTGQRLALERLTDALGQVKPTLLIVANHNTPEDEPVDLASCKVAKIRYQGRWSSPPGGFLSVGSLVDKFIDFVLGNENVTKEN
jgi:hypothetical protein